MEDREKLVRVFNQQAEAYHKYRPGYPPELIRDLMDLTSLKTDSGKDLNHSQEVLEIGCGTGQMTIDLLKAGCKVTAVEKGAALARLAIQNTRDYPDTKIINQSFEKFRTTQRFPLVVSAQAFHWIEKESGLDKVSSLLAPKGYVALIWYLDKSQSTDFWQRTSPLYDYYFSASSVGKTKSISTSPLPDSPTEHELYLLSRLDFSSVIRREYHWTQSYDKDSYLGLLSTFSGHMSLLPKKRKSLFNALGSLIDQFGGTIERHYETVLILGRK